MKNAPNDNFVLILTVIDSEWMPDVLKSNDGKPLDYSDWDVVKGQDVVRFLVIQD